MSALRGSWDPPPTHRPRRLRSDGDGRERNGKGVMRQPGKSLHNAFCSVLPSHRTLPLGHKLTGSHVGKLVPRPRNRALGLGSR